MNMALDFEEDSKSLADYLAILRRRKKQLLWPALITFIIIVLIALLWPSTYRAEATILIEEQEIPKDMVRSTITSYANQQIQVITQRTMTLKNIMELVEKYELYDEAELKRRSRTEIAEEFRDKDVKLNLVSAEVVDPRSGRPVEATIAFTLAYHHGNPGKAQKVTNELVTLYLNENLRSRTEKTASASEFLQAESKALAKQLTAYESELATFKEANEGSLPELYQYNLQIIERTERELLENSLRLKELEKRKVQIESDLTQLSPYSATVLPSGEQVLSDYDRLKALESEYRRKAAVYSAEHPDVIRLSREIAVLKAELGDLSADDKREFLKVEQDKLAALKERYTGDHPKVVAQQRVVNQLIKAPISSGVKKAVEENADNPAYVFQSAQLKATELEINVLKEKAQELKAKQQHYEALVMKSPSVEKEYAALQRDYANAQVKYQEIKAKLMEAQIGQSLEQGRKGERFTLIQPPILPEDPVSPNRFAICFVGIVFSLAVGLGVVFIAETLDKSIRGVKQLGEVLGTAPMITIPYIYLEEELQTNNRKIYYLLGGAVAAVLVALLMLHLFVKPLDVLWYVVMRKLGIG